MRGNRLFVGNLSYSVTKEQLGELFSSYGLVTGAEIIEDKGFGFVEMSSPAEAERAQIALCGYIFQGRALNVAEARTQGSEEALSYQVNRINPRPRSVL